MVVANAIGCVPAGGELGRLPTMIAPGSTSTTMRPLARRSRQPSLVSDLLASNDIGHVVGDDPAFSSAEHGAGVR